MNFFNFKNLPEKSKSSAHLSQALSSSRVSAPEPGQHEVAAHWKPLLEEHKVEKLKKEAQKSLGENGLPFNEDSLKEVLWEIYHTTSCKVKRSALRPLSVIHDQKGSPYVIFRGILGKGAFGKVKLVQNLITKEFGVVKVTTGNPAQEGEFLKKRNLLRGKQERDSKRGKKYYLFIDLLPGITIFDFTTLLTQSREVLTQKQQAKCLSALLKALIKLMEADIYHHDLHDGNVLIDPLSWRANIVDFGMVTDISAEKDKDIFHKTNLRRVLNYVLVTSFITDPALRLLVSDLSATEVNVLAAIKEALKTIKDLPLVGELLAEDQTDHYALGLKELFKKAIGKGDLEILKILMDNFTKEIPSIKPLELNNKSLLEYAIHDKKEYLPIQHHINFFKPNEILLYSKPFIFENSIKNQHTYFLMNEMLKKRSIRHDELSEEETQHPKKRVVPGKE